MRARLGEQSSKWWRDGTSSIQAVVICAIACGVTACQSEDQNFDTLPVKENEAISSEKKDSAFPRPVQPPHPAGDWIKGAPVSESKKTPVPEG